MNDDTRRIRASEPQRESLRDVLARFRWDAPLDFERDAPSKRESQRPATVG